MIEPAIFVFQQDGERTYFSSSWAAAMLFRELIWGPQALEEWAQQFEPLAQWDDDVIGAVFVNHDDRQMTWYGHHHFFDIPKVAEVYEKLLESAWPGYDVDFSADGVGHVGETLGVDNAREYEDDYEPYRAETVLIAAGLEHLEEDYGDFEEGEYTEEGEDEEEYGDFDGDQHDDDQHDDDEHDDDEHDDDEHDDEPVGFDDREPRAWVTIIDSDGQIRHRQLQVVSEDLLNNEKEAPSKLLGLTPSTIPPEACISEAMWIDVPNKRVRLWGNPALQRLFPVAEQAWQGWDIQWDIGPDGYANQCALDETTGQPMSEAEALAAVTPSILSTKRFSLSSAFEALGKRFKKTAIKATGCLTTFLCLPFVFFAWSREDWRIAVFSIAIVVTFVVVAFKYVESRIKKSFGLPISEEDDTTIPVAGPLDMEKRAEAFEQILQKCKLATLTDIAPLLAKQDQDSLDDLIDDVL
jgi:hypothetical protein